MFCGLMTKCSHIDNFCRLECFHLTHRELHPRKLSPCWTGPLGSSQAFGPCSASRCEVWTSEMRPMSCVNCQWKHQSGIVNSKTL